LADRVRESLPALLDILDQIRQERSDTTQAVREKERLFRRFENARQPFLQLANLWCSKFADTTAPGLTDEQYESALAVVANPKKFKKLTGKHCSLAQKSPL
jgi:hypothetical protein